MSFESIRDQIAGLPVVTLRRHARLVPVGDVPAPVRVSVGPAGEAVALWAGDSFWRAQSTPVDRSAEPPVEAWITVDAPERTALARIETRLWAVKAPQPLPGGRFLLPGAPDSYRPERAGHTTTV